MNTVILDARPRSAYDAGHVEGAIHADLDTQLSAKGDPSKGGRHPLPPVERWIAQLREWGITPSTRVIVYDDTNGANAAARAWWMLRAIGHEHVEVIDRDAAIPPASHAATSAWSDDWQWPTVAIEDVDRLRTDPNWRVLDVRSGERYRGETEPIDPIAGHIPGAINLPYTENIGKSPEEIRAMYAELLGDVPPERLVVHCGSGVTACQTLLALDRAGLPGASLYVGSWSEWCRTDFLAVG
ncbi:MAG TPA: rhodanese-like domain-containing protein [Thermoanaerobaculia bacterium]|jgi:thiosulfate/3-mercaptopyruvate sulfurtransferase